MIWRRHLEARYERLCKRWPVEAEPDPAAAATPSERLLRLAEQGQYEALVAQARPVQQPSMVTPEEREAALRAAAAVPASQPAPPAAAKPPAEREAPPPPPPVELSPGELYAMEKCHWRPRERISLTRRLRPGRTSSLPDTTTSEYSPITASPRCAASAVNSRR